ncbi:MAG: hypothetical protein AAB359_00375 [Elusimicrobiota bacterium]
MFEQMLIMPHVLFGLLGILAAVWALVEALNAGEANRFRLKISGIATGVFMWLSYLFGGYWYVTYYKADKAVIVKGPMSWAHTFGMEVKEHIFFVLLLLSMYLSVVIFNNDVSTDKKTRNLAVLVSVLIVTLGLGMEGLADLVNAGIKLGFMGGK